MSDRARSEPIVRTLERPLAGALAAARAACLAEVPEPGVGLRDEVWRLPAGESTLDEALALEIAGRAITLRGNGSTVRLALGGRISAGRLGIEGVSFRCDRSQDTLELVASERLGLRVVELTRGSLALIAPEVAVDARTRVLEATGPVALDVRGREVTLSGAQVRFADDAPAAASRTGIRVTAARTIRATTLGATSVRGERAAGIELAAPDVILLEATAEGVEASAGAGVGIAVVASERIEVSTAQVRAVRGTRAASGLTITAGAPGDAESRLRAFDLTVEGVEATDASGQAAGLLLASGGGAVVRGFTLRRIRGGAAAGALVLFAEASEISVGEIDEVLGREGRAVGMRALGRGTLEDVFVRDVTARAVGARLDSEAAAITSAAGPFATAPSEGWRDWIDASIPAVVAAVSTFAGRAHDAARDREYSAAALPHPAHALPLWPAEQVLAGLVLDAATDAPPPELGAEWGSLVIRDAVVERVAGPAVQLRGGLRPVKLIGLAAWGCDSAGWIQGEDALLAACSLHACGRGPSLGPGVVRAYDLLITDLRTPPSLVLEADAALARVEAVLTNAALGVDEPRVLPLGELPYLAAGSGTLPAALAAGVVPAAEAIDLHLTPTGAARLAELAREVPGEPDVPRIVGAFDVPPPPRCAADDPQRRVPPPVSRPQERDPSLDYRGRDYGGLLQVMLDRARITMQAWTERSAADFSTLLLEALAYRLDLTAQAQERAVAEGFLDTAQLRRSIEDHARVLDAEPDPGLSATTMLSLSLTREALEDPARRAALVDVDGAVRVPAETLVSNGASPTQAVVFATEEPLLLVPELDRLQLADPCAVGATSASLVAREDRAMRFVQPGRWLLFPDGAPGERTGRGHVVRITTLERATDATVIGWDPRRPLPFALPARASILGNVVPAHHGVPLRALGPEERARAAHPLRSLLSLEADGSRGAREVPLPLGPLSVRAVGYPFPHEKERSGVPMIAVSVAGDRWKRVETLATALPSDEVYVVRHEDSVTSTLRFGDGDNGAALPARRVEIAVDMSVGLGASANVGAETLVHVLQLGEGGTPSDRGLLLESLRVTNPLPALGGRDPEPLGRLRYRAPLGVMEPRSAINLADYERLLLEAEGVRGVRARALLDGIRPLIRATVLMSEEDTIDPAERLRRWAGVRRRMEEIRLLGVDVETVPPRWVPLDLDVVVDAAPHAPAAELREAVMEAIGGNGGLLDADRATLGGDLQLSSLYHAVLGVTGVTAVRVKRFRRLALDARDGAEAGVLAMAPDEVPVVRAPRHPGVEDGILTVTVCGGLR